MPVTSIRITWLSLIHIFTKTVDEAGQSRYAPPQWGKGGKSAPYSDIFARSVIRVDCAMNDVVILSLIHI